MTKFRGCWDVRRNCRTHQIRSIDGWGLTTISECVVGAMGELSGVILWVGIQPDAGPTSPSLGKRVGDRSRSEDGIDAFERNGCAQGFDHLLHPRTNVIGLELMDG